MTTEELKESIRSDELEGKQDIIYWTKAAILEMRELKEEVKALKQEMQMDKEIN